MPLFKCSASKAKPKNGIAYITDEKKAKIVSVCYCRDTASRVRRVSGDFSGHGTPCPYDIVKQWGECYKNKKTAYSAVL